MSYTEDIVKAKLASLNDQQESIVTVAGWMLFHKYAVVQPCAA
jgi:regulator of Ty1 transposition protein 103